MCLITLFYFILLIVYKGEKKKKKNRTSQSLIEMTGHGKCERKT